MARAGNLTVPAMNDDGVSTSSTATFTTTETVTDTITVTVVSGYDYMVEHTSMWNSSVSGDYVSVRIREDSVSGTQLGGFDVYLPSSGRLVGAHVRGKFTASSTGSKTFVVTGQRVAGSGNISRPASSANPSILTVEQKS